MQTFDDYVAAATSYIAAALALCVEHSTSIVQVLGFILLVARLIKEVPPAIRLVKKWFGHE